MHGEVGLGSSCLLVSTLYMRGLWESGGRVALKRPGQVRRSDGAVGDGRVVGARAAIVQL
jgi:hypothetical protein